MRSLSHVVAASLLASLGLLPAGDSWAAPPMVFQHLGADDGLSQNTVMATLQDADGTIWLATEDGLNRFDGYTLRRHAHERGNRHSLSSNFVWDIARDADGALWIAAKDGGLGHWNARTGQFSSERHDPARANSLSSNATRRLLLDSRGTLWVATTGGGLNIRPKGARGFQVLRHDPARADSLSSDVVTALAEDRAGRVWIGTDQGLNLWLPKTQGLQIFRHDPRSANTPGSDQISALYVDARGAVWIGTHDAGLTRYDPASGVFTRYAATAERADTLSNADVRAILEDRAGHLWVGTARGLNLLDRARGSFTRYLSDTAAPTTLRDNYIMSLYQDRSGLLWVGTRAGGVSRWNPRSWSLGHEKPAWLAGAYTMAFADDSAGRFWVGTMGAGLRRFDPRSNRWETLEQILGDTHVLRDPRIMSLLVDRADGLWIGTMAEGLVRVTREGRVQRFRSKAGDTRTVGADGIMSLLEARDGRIWAGTFGGGVSRIDPANGRVVRISIDSAGGERATALAEDRSGHIWVGTEGRGLQLLNASGERVRHFLHDPDRRDTLASSTVYALHVDSNGVVWVGTAGGGLDRVVGSVNNPQLLRFENRAMATGLSSDTIYGIRSDAAGGLWLSGNSGLMRLDPRSAALRFFRRQQGAQGDEYNFGAHYRGHNGRLYFGGANGFNAFDPAQSLDRGAPPRVLLTRVEVRNRPLLTLPGAVPAALTLGHRDDNVSFEFAATDFAAPALNHYAYRLRGFDSQWNLLGTSHRVNFTNLDAGDYVLEVQGANASGVWSETPLSLPLKVQPAPWRTRWAYAAYALTIVLLLWSWHRAQQRKLRRVAEQAATLEQIVESRTVELRDRNIELERVSKAKSDFLARMSHEIRTPMNGVIGMTELLLRTELTAQQGQLAGTVSKSAHSLMYILNDILDLSKAEASQLTLEATPFALTDVMQEAASMLASQAQAKGLRIDLEPSPDCTLSVRGDPLRLRQILLNLLGNAIKFTKAGSVTLSGAVLTRETTAEHGAERATLALSVRDTGVGMPANVAAKIFEPFTQADETTTRRYGLKPSSTLLFDPRHALKPSSTLLFDSPGGRLPLASMLCRPPC